MKLRYDYKCPVCAYIKEVRHGMSEEPVVVCIECENEMDKLVTMGGGYVLKGGLWPDKMRRRGTLKYDPPVDDSNY